MKELHVAEVCREFAPVPERFPAARLLFVQKPSLNRGTEIGLSCGGPRKDGLFGQAFRRFHELTARLQAMPPDRRSSRNLIVATTFATRIGTI